MTSKLSKNACLRVVTAETVKQDLEECKIISPALWHSPGPPQLISMLGSSGALEQLPTISITNGSTDYLDRVAASELGGFSAAKGVDKYCREFVCLHLVLETSGAEKEVEGIITVFRRYTDNPDNWVIAQSHYCCEGDFRALAFQILETPTRIYAEGWKNLTTLMLQGYIEKEVDGVQMRLGIRGSSDV